MRIETEMKLDYKDVLIRPKRSTLTSRKDVSLMRKYQFVNAKRSDSNYSQDYLGIPIMAANMDGVGTIEMAKALCANQMFTCLVKSCPADDIVEFFKERSNAVNHTAVSIGIKDEDFETLRYIRQHVKNMKYVNIDVANGYTERFIDFVSRVRNTFPTLVIIAGNVVTGEMTEALLFAGADIVKVGIGPGSCCTTRLQTGVGYPQLSAVIECADAAHGLGGHIIADGGCTCPGDVAKAFAAGADFVMLGSMLAGTDQSGFPTIKKHTQTNEVMVVNDYTDYCAPIYKTEQYIQFYSMSSKIANEKHNGGLQDYRSAEGKEVLTPYKGDVGIVVQNILGGLRSACTYVGDSSLKQLSKRTTFVRVTQQANDFYS